MCRHSFNGKEQEHTNGCIVDVAVIFDSLTTKRSRTFQLDPISRVARSITALATHGYFFVMGNGRSNEHAYRRIVDIFMNEVELKMYEDKGVITDAWIKSSKDGLTMVVTLGDVGAEVYFKGQGFFCKAHQVNIANRSGGGDAFDAGFLDAWLGRCDLNTCLERGLRSAAIILGQPGPQYRSNA
jgi:sugar/nucleoside kinase (ribokinase family)